MLMELQEKQMKRDLDPALGADVDADADADADAAPSVQPMVRFAGVTKRYGSLTVLDALDLEVARNEKVAIIGPSGSGKSTLLRVLMTLDPLTDGLIEVEGEPLTHMRRNGALVPASERHVRDVRRKIGMVFQSFNLFPHMTAIQNTIEAPLRVLGMSRRDANERGRELLSMVGLDDKCNHYPSQLSGGQQQRVAIARALAMRPKVMLFDEVTSALDPQLTGEVLRVMEDLAKDGTTMLLVTHEMAFAKRMADRIIYMHQGKVWEVGSGDMLDAPQTPELRTFLNNGL